MMYLKYKYVFNHFSAYGFLIISTVAYRSIPLFRDFHPIHPISIHLEHHGATSVSDGIICPQSSGLGWRLCRQECGSISLVAGLPVISPNLRDISTPFGFVETKKRDAVLWKQDSFYPVPCFQVRFKRWQDCATLLVPNPRTCCRSSPAVYESSCKGLSSFRLTSKSQAARFMSELSITGFTDTFYCRQDNQWK